MRLNPERPIPAADDYLVFLARAVLESAFSPDWFDLGENLAKGEIHNSDV